jgi:hypothetical protein
LWPKASKGACLVSTLDPGNEKNWLQEKLSEKQSADVTLS